MRAQSQVCTQEQAKELKKLGVVYETPLWYWNDMGALVNGKGPEDWGNYPAFTVSELFKMLPFIIRHEENDYFMTFSHGSKGYRVIYETQKLDLIFNLYGDLDREKKTLFGTFRSGKNAAEVLAEYMLMLLDSNSDVLPVEQVNERLRNTL